MAGPYLPNLVRVVVQYEDTRHGPLSNTFHVDRGSVGIDNVLPAFALSYDAFWADGLGSATYGQRQYTSQDVTLVGYRAQDLSQPDGAVFEENGPTIGAAGQSASRLAPDLAVVISWRSNINGRRGRGRTYIGALGMDYNENVSGLIRPDVSEGLEDNANGLIADLPTNGLTLVVYSRVGSGGMTTINNATVDRHFDVQRRRGD